jgi:hypothetical protein
MSEKPNIKDNTAELAFLDDLAAGMEEDEKAAKPSDPTQSEDAQARAKARNAMLDTSAELAFLDELGANQVSPREVSTSECAGAIRSLTLRKAVHHFP